jgi:hypothetical protein
MDQESGKLPGFAGKKIFSENRKPIVELKLLNQKAPVSFRPKATGLFM